MQHVSRKENSCVTEKNKRFTEKMEIKSLCTVSEDTVLGCHQYTTMPLANHIL